MDDCVKTPNTNSFGLLQLSTVVFIPAGSFAVKNYYF